MLGDGLKPMPGFEKPSPTSSPCSISRSVTRQGIIRQTCFMISFIVPAHNEEALLGRTLSTLHNSVRALGEPYEIVVVDDASTDRTGEIAAEHDVRTISVSHRQIAATRNAGAAVATGDTLIFVDADTMITEPALRAAIDRSEERRGGKECSG